MLEILVCDSHLTGKPEVGRIAFPLRNLTPDVGVSLWLPLESPGTKKGKPKGGAAAAQRVEGEVLLELTYKVR